MTRIKISFAILLILIGSAFYFGDRINRSGKRLIATISEIQSEKHSSDKQAVKKGAAKLENEWEKFYKESDFVIRNDKLIEAERTVSRIKSLAENDNDELDADLSELKSSIEYIINSEMPYFHNIF